LGKIYQRLRILLILLRIGLNVGARIITVDVAQSFIGKAIKLLAVFKRNTYCLSKVGAPYHPEYYQFYFVRALNDQEVRKNFLGKTPGSFPIYKKWDYIGRYLMHSQYEAERSDILGYPDERITIGYPKMMPTWVDYAETHEVIWDHPFLECSQPIITVLLLGRDTYMHDPNDSVDVFLEEILTAVRRYYKKELIVLKNKPRLGSPRDDWLDNYLESITDKRVILSSVPAPFLAQRSKLMFMVGDTGGCFDFIIREVPSIEHTRYSEGWIKNYPEQSGWGIFNIPRTSTVSELDQAIKEIHTGQFRALPMEEVKTIISHRDDENFVDKL